LPGGLETVRFHRSQAYQERRKWVGSCPLAFSDIEIRIVLQTPLAHPVVLHVHPRRPGVYKNQVEII